MTNPVYGRVVSEVVYKDGLATTTKQKMIVITKTPTRKALLDAIFDELKQLQPGGSVCFEVFACKHTSEPSRVEVTQSILLD